MTVALAIGMERMAKRNVIVRRLVAVESLGSCTFIVSDKTGTLTVNELTARRIVFGNEPPWEITGEGMIPEGTILTPRGTPDAEQYALLERLCQTVVLSNEGALSRRDNDWTHYGDAADVALLVMAHKMGIVQPETNNTFPQIAVIPFESEHKFSAALNVIHGKSIASVKGAMERLLPMCSKAATLQGESSLDAEAVIKQAHSLAAEGYRVLAVANCVNRRGNIFRGTPAWTDLYRLSRHDRSVAHRSQSGGGRLPRRRYSSIHGDR